MTLIDRDALKYFQILEFLLLYRYLLSFARDQLPNGICEDVPISRVRFGLGPKSPTESAVAAGGRPRVWPPTASRTAAVWVP